jgi:hypothetical protein
LYGSTIFRFLLLSTLLLELFTTSRGKHTGKTLNGYARKSSHAKVFSEITSDRYIK